LAKVAGRATLRLANASRLPFEYLGFADNIALYIQELEELADNMRDEIEENNQRLSDGTFTAALDQTKKLGPPKYKKPVPYINFAPLKNALKKLHDAANQYDKISSNLTDRLNEINQLLFTSERLMTRKEGLPGRDWYKHHIYAPGFYTGYGVKTIPGVREAIEQGNYTLLEEQIDVAADVINGISERIHLIVSIMGK
jgi:N-acetylated-alpha-linked acidic dipeptidase